MTKIFFFHTGKDQELFFDIYPFVFISNYKLELSRKNFKYFSELYSLGSSNIIVVSRWYYREYLDSFHSLPYVNSANLLLYDSCDSSDDLKGNIPLVFRKVLRKQYYSDFSFYKLEMTGGKHFSNYYFEKHGLKNKINKDRAPHNDDSVLKRLVLFHNLLIGFYLDNVLPFPVSLNKLIRMVVRICVNNNLVFIVKAIYKGHARFIYTQLSKMDPQVKIDNPEVYLRFGYANFDTSVTYHRKSVLEFFNNNFNTTINHLGPVNVGLYKKELQKGYNWFISPFGTGEICYRDFEIIYNNNFLVKPKMNHLETYPNVYKNDSLQYELDFSNIGELLSNENVIHYYNQLKEQRGLLCQSYKSLQFGVNAFF